MKPAGNPAYAAEKSGIVKENLDNSGTNAIIAAQVNKSLSRVAEGPAL
jgi:hypothetical protein